MATQFNTVVDGPARQNRQPGKSSCYPINKKHLFKLHLKPRLFKAPGNLNLRKANRILCLYSFPRQRTIGLRACNSQESEISVIIWCPGNWL